MNPTPPPTDPATAGQPLVEFVRAQRQTAAYIVLAVAAVLMIASAWLAYRGFRSVQPDAPADTPLTTAPDAPKKPVADVKRGDYVVGWIATLTAFLATAGAGVWLLVGLPNPSVERQRTDIRLLILGVGAVVGAVLIMSGVLYFYRWSDSLAKWLDKDEQQEALWVVIPLLMVVLGAGVVLAAVQPARAEERHKPGIRKAVYWSNFGLTALLLLVGIVVANVVFALKVPNKLDATATGFYTLGDSTKAFLGQLNRPVKAYMILPEVGEREVNDIREFLKSCETASGGKFKMQPVSPVTNKNELDALRRKFTKIDRSVLGILLTVGEDESRHAFLPYQDLFKSERGPTGKGSSSFDAENQVMKEVRFLADNEQKPVLYFTQSNGEASLTGGGEGAVGSSITMLKAYLEKGYYEVKPLVFAQQNPTVPADAMAVVIVEPTSAFTPDAVAALRKYMTTPQGDRKGKLIVFCGASPGLDGRGVAKVGLDGLLAEFNVRLGDKYVYSWSPQATDPRVASGMWSRAGQSNPISQALAPLIPTVGMAYPREVTPLQTNQAFQATPILITSPRRVTWLEDDRITDPKTVEEVLTVPAVAAKKQLSDDPRPVGVVVAEGGKGRAVVYGCGMLVFDEQARSVRSGSPSGFELANATIDWLRDRVVAPTGVESKKYVEYQFPDPNTLDSTRLLFFPVGLMILVVAGLGTALWAIRRR